LTVELPKKHGRGGQSALRFARLRLEKRHNYVRKVAEMAVQFFITNDKVRLIGCFCFCFFKRRSSMNNMMKHFYDDESEMAVGRLIPSSRNPLWTNGF
jgi:hypothetical protein